MKAYRGVDPPQVLLMRTNKNTAQYTLNSIGVSKELQRKYRYRVHNLDNTGLGALVSFKLLRERNLSGQTGLFMF